MDEFHPSKLYFGEEEGEDVASGRITWENARLRKLAPTLSLAQKYVLYHRRLILQYMDRLEIYEVSFGSYSATSWDLNTTRPCWVGFRITI